MEEQEVWKDVVGYEGQYMVSNLGRIKSLNYRRTGTEHMLKPSMKKPRTNNSTGYYWVCLCDKHGIHRMGLIHRLVMDAFCPNPDPELYTHINHKDENGRNNKLDNLEWCTPKYNINYGTRTLRQRLTRYINRPPTPKPKMVRRSIDWRKIFAGKSPDEIARIINDSEISHVRKSLLRRRYLRKGKTLAEISGV